MYGGLALHLPNPCFAVAWPEYCIRFLVNINLRMPWGWYIPHSTGRTLPLL